VPDEEYSHLYVFNLRGNARTQGEERRKEAGGIFGEGSRTPVVISHYGQRPGHAGACELRYHDIGDYLSREEKLKAIEGFGSIATMDWQRLHPNDSGDWINQRDPAFDKFMPLGDKEADDAKAVFGIYSQGLLSARDSWAYNMSRNALESNMRRMIDAFNADRAAIPSYALARPKTSGPMLKGDRHRAEANQLDAQPQRADAARQGI
jgi:predicted helicase